MAITVRKGLYSKNETSASTYACTGIPETNELEHGCPFPREKVERKLKAKEPPCYC
jgi:hypothetical protein